MEFCQLLMTKKRTVGADGKWFKIGGTEKKVREEGPGCFEYKTWKTQKKTG